MCKPCVGAKLVLRFQALIAHALFDRSILFLYHKSACRSGSICRKRISFISRFGAIVSHFVRGDILFDSPCMWPGIVMANSYLACQVGYPYWRRGRVLVCGTKGREFESRQGHPCLRVTNGAANRMGLWPLSPGADG